MSILLAGEFDAAERAQWLGLLRAALPDETLVTEPTDADSIDIAIVANPPAGALQGLPKLRLIQSLWAGVDRLLADDSVPSEVPAQPGSLDARRAAGRQRQEPTAQPATRRGPHAALLRPDGRQWLVRARGPGHANHGS